MKTLTSPVGLILSSGAIVGAILLTYTMLKNRAADAQQERLRQLLLSGTATTVVPTTAAANQSIAIL